MDTLRKHLKDWNRVLEMGEIGTDPNPGSKLGSCMCRHVRLRQRVRFTDVQQFN